MGAIVKACGIKTRIKNTGKELDTAMNATAMLIALHAGVKFTATDLLLPSAWMDTLIHQRKAFPLFGQQAPIRTISNNAESDVTINLDDGTTVFLRYGVYNRMFETTSGGFLYAKSLQSLNKSGYRILEIDQNGQMLARKNDDGTFSGFITDFMYSPSPMLADFKTSPYKNRFQISYSPVEIVNNGIIFEGAEELLSKMGLIDIEVLKGTAAASATNLFVKLQTECAGTNLVDLLGTVLANPTNFVVTNKATGAVITITGAAIVNGEMRLTGVFTSGVTYHVAGSDPSIWLANLIDGYDASPSASNGVDILVP